ncbi:MAG: IS4 family transposase, partial [Patescibacteria group bacterium]
CKEILAIHDTTYLNFTSRRTTEGLGPIGSKENVQGFLAHNTLAVNGQTGEVLGLLAQEVWARQGQYPKEEQSKERRGRKRESQRWPRGIETVIQRDLGNAIHLMDREGDIYEVLRDLNAAEGRYVIRAGRNRLLAQKQGYLFEAIRRQEPLATMTVHIPTRAGQKARAALLTLRCAHLTIPPPETPRRKGENIPVHAIEAYERHPPKATAPLHWILLTQEPIETPSECVRVVALYKCRWKIEEFHMGLKTGCGIEDRQLKTRKRLEVLLGFYSVIGVMLLRLRDAARGEGLASNFLSDIQIRLLKKQYPALGKSPKAREALRAVAKLGGFLARKGDGEPGWRTLWRGMQELLLMEHGFHLSQQFVHTN